MSLDLKRQNLKADISYFLIIPVPRFGIKSPEINQSLFKVFNESKPMKFVVSRYAGEKDVIYVNIENVQLKAVSRYFKEIACFKKELVALQEKIVREMDKEKFQEKVNVWFILSRKKRLIFFLKKRQIIEFLEKIEKEFDVPEKVIF